MRTAFTVATPPAIRVGKCKSCGAVRRIEGEIPNPHSFYPTEYGRCACGKYLKYAILKAARNDTKCDSRCVNASSSVCNCSCGGANHATGFCL